MTTAHSNVPSRRSSPYSSGGLTEVEVDRSTRTPVLFFLGWAMFWLLFSSAFGLIASLKLHWPQFLGDVEMLTYGRVQAVFRNAFLYGWASSGGFAVGLWLMARLSQATLRHGSLLLVAGVFWNIGVLLGLGGILAGRTTSLLALEMPFYTAPILLVSYALVMVWGVFTFHSRQYRTTFTSQWYLVAAFFWFPWIYSVAQLMLVVAPMRGTLQAVGNAWYAYNFFALWLAPSALAAIYYFLPKMLGRPIRYYYLAKVAFWSYALIAPWCGVASLSSGPVPAWIPTAGIVAMTLLIVPVAIIALNFLSTLSGLYGKARGSATLTFALVGIAAFVVFHLAQALFSYRNYQEVIQFTHFSTAFWFLGKYVFFSMTVFGAIYFLLPRVTGRAWPMPNMIKIHFLLAVAGGVLILASLFIAGWSQGVKMNAADVAFVEATRATIPWMVATSIGWILLIIGHIAFVWNAVSLMTSRSVSKEAEAVLLANPPEMKVQTT